MFSKTQLEFIKGALTAPGVAVPAQDNGKMTRVFVSVLDEIDAQLAEGFAEHPKLRAVDDSAK